MKNNTVRITDIQIQNLKNVRNGNLHLENPRKYYKASIVGLYGQNGSGKTAVIDAIALLQYTLCGRPIPSRFADIINVDAEYAQFRFDFKINSKEDMTSYIVKYEFKLCRESYVVESNADLSGDEMEKVRAVVFDERISYSYETADVVKSRMKPMIEPAADAVFGPKSQYIALVGGNGSTAFNLFVAKKIAADTSRSFVFSRELLTVIRNNAVGNRGLFVLEALVNFGNFELFIVDNKTSGLIASTNDLPIAFCFEDEVHGAAGSVPISLNGPSKIPTELFEVVESVLQQMNVVLRQIVPDLALSAVKLSEGLSKTGTPITIFQLVSHKNSKEIPLMHESEGIKKIVAILHLLIGVYNNPSMTVAVDELDAGIFEYLLGELIRIISDGGKGQLIFTSHNLRPLETLDRGFIAFTTTNPDNRYVRFSNIKNNNNLRSTYYRNIILEESGEHFYDMTNNAEIAHAFRKAGRMYV